MLKHCLLKMKGVIVVRVYPFPVSLLNLALAGLTAGIILSTVPSSARANAATAPSVNALADDYFDHYLFAANPSMSTELGVHQYDAQLEDYSPKAIAERVAALKAWQKKVEAVDLTNAPVSVQDDRDLLLNDIKSELLTLEVIKPWQKNPDFYSTLVANAAFVIIARDYAPADQRMRDLTAREIKMAELLRIARKNLVNAPKIYTQIALEQIPGIIAFFQTDVPLAFVSENTQPDYEAFNKANEGVIQALRSYQEWLKVEVLPRSKGDFRLGEKVFREKLALDEMVDLPLDQLRALNQQNMQANTAEYKKLAAEVYPDKTLSQAVLLMQADHPAPKDILRSFQSRFDHLIQFIRDKNIIDIPSKVQPTLEETPAFLRAITLASMDTPGPFEKHATKAFFNVTLPQPDWSEKRVKEFMGQFSYPTLNSVAVHEAYPGHYVQFLWLHQVPSRLRQVIGSSSNAEGWAHYTEQMMLDEGLGEYLNQGQDNDAVKRLRMGELEEALLRNARFEVAIQLHTGKMSFNQAVDYFVKSGYQPPAIALIETKRATEDPMYLYYTLGKLEILKLRHDLEAKEGSHFNLKQFHNNFMRQGYPPIKVVRHALMGDNSPVL